jgi:hypothetical protein
MLAEHYNQDALAVKSGIYQVFIRIDVDAGGSKPGGLEGQRLSKHRSL